MSTETTADGVQESSRAAAAQTQELEYRQYSGEHEIDLIMSLVDEELSEPYNKYTFRYFLVDWPHLCWMVRLNVKESADSG